MFVVAWSEIGAVQELLACTENLIFLVGARFRRPRKHAHQYSVGPYLGIRFSGDRFILSSFHLAM